MPETPETRLIAEQLHFLLHDRWIHQLRKNEKSRYFNIPFAGEENMNYNFPLYVESVKTKGKLIIFSLLNNAGQRSWLLSNLGMEGRWVQTEESHTGLVLLYGSYSYCPQCIFYDDSRHFGILRYINDEHVFLSIINKMGPDLLQCSLDGTFDPLIFLARLRKKNSKPIAEVLLDQDVIAGIGNYLRSDILYLSEISPDILVESLSDDQLVNLIKIASNLVLESYSLNGFTIHTYHSVDGKMGQYKPRAYGRTVDDYGRQIYRYSDKDNRTVFTVYPC